MSRSQDLLSHFTPEQIERLEIAAEAQAERVAKAAVDPSNSVVVDGIDISPLWFAVERLREELLTAKSAPVAQDPAPEAQKPAEAPQEPSEAVAEVEPEEPKAKVAPKKRQPRKTS